MIKFFLFLFVIYCLFESIRPNRVQSVATWLGLFQIYCQLFGDLLAIPIFAFCSLEAPRIFCKKSERNLRLISDPIFTSYHPCPWLISPWLSWIWLILVEVYHDFFQTYENKNYEEEYLTPSKHDAKLEWLHAEKEDAPILIILPTFTGHITAAPIASTSYNFHSKGWRVVVCAKVMADGFKSECVTQERMWCFRNYEDQENTILHIKQRFPEASLYGYGCSLGGALWGNYLTKKGKSTLIKGVVIYDAGLDFLKCGASADRRLPLFSSIISKNAAAGWLNWMKWKGIEECKVGENTITKSDAESLKSSLVKFYKLACLGNGFKDLSTYLSTTRTPYKKNSKFPVPTLILTSNTDVFMGREFLKEISALCKKDQNVINLVHRYGAHACRWSGWSAEDWQCSATFQFLHNVHEASRNNPLFMTEQLLSNTKKEDPKRPMSSYAGAVILLFVFLKVFIAPENEVFSFPEFPDFNKLREAGMGNFT